MSVYTVRGVTSHKGHEGEPLAQCTICRDGKKVAEYHDGDWGGGGEFFWGDERAPKVKRTIPRYDDKGTIEIDVTPEEGLLWDHVAGKTTDICKGLEGVEPMIRSLNPELFVSDLIDDFLQNRKYRKEAKTHTIFRLQGDVEGNYWTLKRPFNLPTKQWLQNKYGARLVEIINETLGQVAV
jgi:hypothetical protein